MATPAQLNTAVAAMVADLNVSWKDFATFLRGKLVEAAMTGGVVSYQVNGRSVTKSTAELREMLKIANSHVSGGIVMQLGEF